MRKLLIGVIAVMVACVAGYFGLQFYVQQRIAHEVDAAFEQTRASGGTATRGRLAFDLFTRTLTIADIAVQSATQPPITVKVGSFTASGLDLPQAGRFSAERVVIADVEGAGTLAMQGGLRLAYKAPRIELAGFSGPAGPLRQVDPASPVDLWRAALEHFSTVTAASIAIPTVTASMTPSAPDAAGKGLGPADYVYSGIAVRDVHEGRAAAVTADRFSYTTTMTGPDGTEQLTGEIVKLAAFDFDSASTLAMLDPARANDDKYYRAYRQLTAGAYTASLGNGIKLQIEAMTADDVGMRPSRLQLKDILAIADSVPAPGTQPSPAQLQEMMQKVAGIYEGIRIVQFDMRGVSMEMPDSAVKLGLIRVSNLENGRIGEFAFEGLDVRTPKTPVTVGRFALKALDIANLMRLSAQMAGTQTPAPEQIAALLKLIEGAELKGVVTPYKDTGPPVSIDTLNISWGEHVGPVPSKARVTMKLAGPVDMTDPEPFKTLADAGFPSATLSFDLGAAWAESTRSMALEPAEAEIGNVGAATLRFAIANVPREIFSIDPFEIMIAAALIEAGPVELVLRDTGGIDLAVAQYARTKSVTREAARKALVDNIRQGAAAMAALSPDVMAVAGAVSRFIETPRGTLTLRLTPKGKVALMQVVESLRTDPVAALERFQIEATTGR